jgi:hypothetical protein
MYLRRTDREQDIMSWIKAHLKALAAAVGFVAAAIVGVTGGGINGVTEWTVVLVALANAVQVYITPNLIGGAAKYSKEISAAVIAVGAALPSVIEGGLSGQEKLMLVCLVLGAFGVVIPNVGYKPAVKLARHAER